MSTIRVKDMPPGEYGCPVCLFWYNHSCRCSVFYPLTKRDGPLYCLSNPCRGMRSRTVECTDRALYARIQARLAALDADMDPEFTTLRHVRHIRRMLAREVR